MNKLLYYLLGIALSIGLLGFSVLLICQALSAIGVRLVSTKIQLPASFEYPQNLKIDDSGNIYCYTRSYSRLQIYDSRGCFLIGWFIRFPNRIEIDNKSGHIMSTDWKARKIVYDLDGSIISETKIQEFDDDPLYSPNDNKLEHQDLYSNRYKYAKTFVTPYVTKISPKGHEQKIILSEPFYLWPIRWFFPCSFFLIGPPMIWAIERSIVKKKMKTLKPG